MTAGADEGETAAGGDAAPPPAPTPGGDAPAAPARARIRAGRAAHRDAPKPQGRRGPRAYAVLLVASALLAVAVVLLATSWDVRSRFATLGTGLRVTPTTTVDAATLEELESVVRARLRAAGILAQLQRKGEDVRVAVPSADAARARSRLGQAGRVQVAAAREQPAADESPATWFAGLEPAAGQRLVLDREAHDVGVRDAWIVRDEGSGRDALALELAPAPGAAGLVGKRVAFTLDRRVIAAPTLGASESRLILDGAFEPGVVDDLLASLKRPYPCDVMVLRE